MRKRTELTLTNAITQNRETLSSNVDNETILLSITTSRYYGMADTANRIWELLARPTTGDAIVTHLLEEYVVDRKRCEEEVLPFLRDLLEAELIVIV